MLFIRTLLLMLCITSAYISAVIFASNDPARDTATHMIVGFIMAGISLIFALVLVATFLQ